MIFTGLLFGFLFGFLLKRSRFCPTGTIRDIYLEKRYYNLVLLLAIIFTNALIYHILRYFDLVPMTFFAEFPVIGIALGSFIFGFGAIMCNGCLTSTLIKSGDGRIIGLISLVTFTITSYIAVKGPLKPISKYFESGKLTLPDEFIDKLPLSPIILCAIIVLVLYFLMFKHYKSHKLKFKLPSRYTGLRHIFCEKMWSKELTVILIGLLMGLAFYFSSLTGRVGSFGISTPILTWADKICPIETAGIGWGVDGQGLGWGSMFVLGIILGSFFTSFISKEFSIIMPNKKTIIYTIIGSALMALGAIWGQGCIISNGFVFTAQLSMKGWFAFVFLMLGIWISARIFLVTKQRS